MIRACASVVLSTASTLLVDVKYGWRFLRRHPGFTAVATGTLAIGLGMSTAIFGAEYAIALKPLPYPRADRIVVVRAADRATPGAWAFLSRPFTNAVIAENRTFEAVGVAQPVTVTLRTAGATELVTGEQVSGSYFDVYRTAPLLGRAITLADTAPGAGHVVVLSHAVWQGVFGGARDVIGRVVDLAAGPSNAFMPFTPSLEPYLVVGVMPARDRFPTDDGLWVPLVQWAPDPRMSAMSGGPRLTGGGLTVAARLRDGRSMADARSDVQAIGDRWVRANAARIDTWFPDVVTPASAAVPQYATAVLLLVAAVNAVLLLACVSLGGLLAARTRARREELAVREALGATRARLVQQLLVESTIMAVAGGGLGLGVAFGSTRVLRAIAPARMAALRSLTLDWPVVVYAAAACVAGGVAIGLLPAVQLLRTQRLTAMRLTGGPGGSTRRSRRARRTLIAAEIALVFPLVTGATLALRSFDRLVAVDLGYRTDHVLVMSVKLSGSRCPARRFDACLATIDSILERERALPGVTSAAMSGTRPFDITNVARLSLDAAATQSIAAEFNVVTPGYFGAMGLTVRAGRPLDARDIDGRTPVIVINETFARQLFGGGDALGRQLNQAPMGRPARWFTIVGVVVDANDRSLSASPMPAFYLPLAQERLILRTTLVIRTARDPKTLGLAAAAAVASVDPDAPVTGIDALDRIVSTAAAEPRFNTALLGTFASFGLLVALLGIYGLVAYSVGERHREFGVRRAVGASSVDLFRLVVGEGVAAVGGGLFVGVGLAAAAGRWYRSQLFAISPDDPATLAGVAVLIVAVAALAYGLPARRATQVDPVVVLRAE